MERGKLRVGWEVKHEFREGKEEKWVERNYGRGAGEIACRNDVKSEILNHHLILFKLNLIHS